MSLEKKVKEALGRFPHGISPPNVEKGRQILDQDTAVTPIGIIKDEFLDFCKEINMSYVQTHRPEDLLTHPQQLGCIQSARKLYAFFNN